ncbi:MAG: hypothetical protein Q7U56_05035 [Humidesulfovibrio sp.]|nr:hypothetical protein [Humidesulfovibrio sp.]
MQGCGKQGRRRRTVASPGLQTAFGVAPFALGMGFLFACAPLLLLVDELRKAIVRRRPA